MRGCFGNHRGCCWVQTDWTELLPAAGQGSQAAEPTPCHASDHLQAPSKSSFSQRPERERDRVKERERKAHTVTSLSRKILALYMKTGKGKEAF